MFILYTIQDIKPEQKGNKRYDLCESREEVAKVVKDLKDSEYYINNSDYRRFSFQLFSIDLENLTVTKPKQIPVYVIGFLGENE